MNIDKPQMPNTLIKRETGFKVTTPNSQVSGLKETNVMHHDGQHVTLPGSNKLSGKGKASEVAATLGRIKNAIQ